MQRNEKYFLHDSLQGNIQWLWVVALRKKRMALRVSGVAMAIIGAVLIIHTVPVFIWYIILFVLILAVEYFMLK